MWVSLYTEIKHIPTKIESAENWKRMGPFADFVGQQNCGEMMITSLQSLENKTKMDRKSCFLMTLGFESSGVKGFEVFERGK